MSFPRTTIVLALFALCVTEHATVQGRLRARGSGDDFGDAANIVGSDGDAATNPQGTLQMNSDPAANIALGGAALGGASTNTGGNAATNPQSGMGPVTGTENPAAESAPTTTGGDAATNPQSGTGPVTGTENPAAEKVEADRVEAERKKKVEADRVEAERKKKVEADRVEAERKKKVEAERVEAERKKKVEADRVESEW